MENQHFRRGCASLLAVVMLLTATAALAQTVEPIQELMPESLAGHTFTATLKTYDTEIECFPAVFYEKDTYKKEEVESLKVGDALVFCDGEHIISNIGKSPMDTLELQFEDGEEILLDENEDGTFSARMSTDDMECMHIQDEWNLKPAADIVLIDRSYIEKDEPVTVNGLEAILKLQAQREEESIGFDYTVTTIELNENSEIAVIHVAYAPWQ